MRFKERIIYRNKYRNKWNLRNLDRFVNKSFLILEQIKLIHQTNLYDYLCIYRLYHFIYYLIKI